MAAVGRYMKNIDSREVVVHEYCLLGVDEEKWGKLYFGASAVIRSHTVIYGGTCIGNDFTSGHHVLVRNGCRIGDNVSVGTSSVIEHSVIIGDNVRIHSHCFIPEYSEICSNAWIGPKVVFTNAKYPQSKNVKKNLVGPKVGEFVIIGANVTLLPGVEIGRGALIGAGSVVTSDVPPDEVWVGNPARKIKDVHQLEEYSVRKRG